MAAINTKVVRRSHALAGLPYGDLLATTNRSYVTAAPKPYSAPEG
jgi:hypothetical protein